MILHCQAGIPPRIPSTFPRIVLLICLSCSSTTSFLLLPVLSSLGMILLSHFYFLFRDECVFVSLLVFVVCSLLSHKTSASSDVSISLLLLKRRLAMLVLMASFHCQEELSWLGKFQLFLFISFPLHCSCSLLLSLVFVLVLSFEKRNWEYCFSRKKSVMSSHSSLQTPLSWSFKLHCNECSRVTSPSILRHHFLLWSN